jgi:hypothetical protein
VPMRILKTLSSNSTVHKSSSATSTLIKSSFPVHMVPQVTDAVVSSSSMSWDYKGDLCFTAPFAYVLLPPSLHFFFTLTDVYVLPAYGQEYYAPSQLQLFCPMEGASQSDDRAGVHIGEDLHTLI